VSLQPITLGPVVADANLFRALDGLRVVGRDVQRQLAPLQRLGASLALLAETEPRRRRLVAQLGARNAYTARAITALPLHDAVAILDAVEHDVDVEPRLQLLVDVMRAALSGATVTRRDVVRARRAARRPVRASERRRRDRRVDHRPRIRAGCTSRPRAPGCRGFASTRAAYAHARPVLNTRGSPV
jgi:hypothetical protein